jgi:sporulation protein YlmC with PRC-barrel domain
VPRRTPLPDTKEATMTTTQDLHPAHHLSTAPGDTGPGPALMSAETLMGNDVGNLQGEDLGAIKDLMIDMRSGKMAYAVLSYGGLLGVGDKLFAVPWGALTLDTANKRFTLKVHKDALEKAPGFDKDHWPSMADKTWASEVHRFYDTPYTAD